MQKNSSFRKMLAVMLAVLMALSVLSVAASASLNLQSAIDDAAPGSTVTMKGNTTESVVITKDLTLDLGGYQLTGEEGKPAITIRGADVTVTNGHVYSKFANVRTVTMLETVKNESPAAIGVRGGSVTVKGVRAIGSFTRVPGQSKYGVPTGSAVALTDGATATIIQSSLVGRYGVNNKVTNEAAGGTVTVHDAIMMGFMKAVKDASKEVLDGAEKVNAADRIEGFLNNGIELEARERNLMKKVFADRVMLYTQSVSGDSSVITVETTPCPSTTVKVSAYEDQSNLWYNNTSTDCSYRYVPEYAVLSDGTLIKLTFSEDEEKYIAEVEPDQAEAITSIKYRLEFEMQPDIKRYATNFDKYLQKLYDLVITTADTLYGELVDKYDTYVDLVGDLFAKVDEMGMMRIMGQKLESADIYQRLVHALLELGGETMYYKGDTTKHFGPSQLFYFYGDQNYQLPEGEYYGVLDHVAELKAELEAIKGPSFADQSMWADLGYWFFENYNDVIDMLDDVAEKIDALQDILSDDLIQAAVTEAGLADKQQTLDKIATIIDDMREAIGTLLASHTISDVLVKLEKNKSEIKPYINKFISIYNNRDKYFTPEKFIDGDFAKAYAQYEVPVVDAVVEDCDHSWDDGVLTADGIVTVYTCTRCGATKTECSKDVLWAGYEHQLDDITLDEGDKPTVEAHNIFVIAKKDAIKVQIRYSSGSTLTFSREGVGGGRAVKSISDVIYDGVDCELWVVDYMLNAGTYTAIAKYYYSMSINNIADASGSTFEIDTPSYGTAVYSVEAGIVDDDYGYIVFDGRTKQVITVVTGTDVQKVQFRVDETGVTLTYNASNAQIENDTLADGTPVLVWTIERLFARGEYAYSVYTRSILGLSDSGKDLMFKVGAPSDDVLLASVSVEVDAENGKDVFTVVTQNTVSKVKFTNTSNGGTITATKTGTDKINVSVADNADGKTMTWTITVSHYPGVTFDCQALLGNTYSGAKQVTVPADPKETLLYSVTNAVSEDQANVTFTVVTHQDAAKVKLTNKSNGGTITALPGGNEKVSVNISEPNANGQKTWTITIKYMTKTANVTYDCQAFIGETFQSDVLQTVVEAPAAA